MLVARLLALAEPLEQVESAGLLEQLAVESVVDSHAAPVAVAVLVATVELVLTAAVPMVAEMSAARAGLG